jgi:hypothetical protein
MQVRRHISPVEPLLVCSQELQPTIDIIPMENSTVSMAVRCHISPICSHVPTTVGSRNQT